MGKLCYAFGCTKNLFAAIGAMNSEIKNKKWLFAGIGLQLAVGYTLAYLVYQIGTLINDGKVGDGFVGGLVAIGVAVVFIIVLGIRSNAKMKAEYEAKRAAMKAKRNSVNV